MNSTGAATQTANEERLYRIGDVARKAEVKPFVLRYWETEFPMLEPVKSPSGHRMYRQEDVDMVMKIKRLLYDEGFHHCGRAAAFARAERDGVCTIGFACTFFKLDRLRRQQRSPCHGDNPAELLSRKMLLDLRDSLRAFLTLLERR